MARNKKLGRKLRLAAALRSNRNPPVWVRLKTKNRVTRSPTWRNWRRVKLKA
ncbi:MAG: 50S ribosomal protein L39e [Thermoproteus sp. AZ2]|jgi:large subunit ribosomal protein L39e|uniref:50S ribosomal protein L39e n=1 Tax=Thermoproteus sp. AZ2 TaxID=1609232 RepID=A0ACC6UYX7_9CREN|nr:MAG: 50S ribosomal protein L39 [Thermoproteus sp. AZ2]